jgi:hypothetical protein
MTTRDVPTDLESPESLELWAQKIEKEIAEITAILAPLRDRLAAAREKLDLVNRLIHLSSPDRSRSRHLSQASSASPTPSSSPGIEDRIEEILRSTGSPMHIRDIRNALIQKGVPLPGKGDEANIILRLRRDNARFIRTERGTYALVEWNLPAYAPAPRTKKVRRRKAVTR